MQTTTASVPIAGNQLISAGTGTKRDSCPNVSVLSLIFKQLQGYFQCGQSHNAGVVATLKITYDGLNASVLTLKITATEKYRQKQRSKQITTN